MNKALELFNAVPRRHNCAQAVASGCGREDLCAALQAAGGGRAPEGLCGAVYAAMLLVPGRAEEIQSAFAARLGSAQCTALKQELRVSCPDCVALGAELAEKYGIIDES